MILGLIVTVVGFNSPSSEARYKPTEADYARDTKLMVNICERFAHEKDAKALHKAAVATAYARVVNCLDYNNECNLYGQFLTLTTNVSKDGSITSEERIQMRKHLDELKTAVSDGKIKLSKDKD